MIAEQINEAYESCDTLPFINFIELSVTGDLKWLIKSGTPANLDEVCEKIQSEYSELSNDTSTNEILDIDSNIAYYQGRQLIVSNIVFHLRQRRLEGLIEVLQSYEEWGFGFDLSYEDLDADLDRTELIMKGELMRLNQLLGQKEEIAETKTGKATKKDWYARLAAIDKYRQSPPTNPANISTMQFIVMDQDFSAYIAILKAQNDKGGY